MSLEKASDACRVASQEITFILNVAPANPWRVPRPPVPAATPSGVTSFERPKRRKLFSGLGKLLSGLVLLSGDALAIPTITLGSVTTLPVLGSLAGGIWSWRRRCTVPAGRRVNWDVLNPNPEGWHPLAALRGLSMMLSGFRNTELF